MAWPGSCRPYSQRALLSTDRLLVRRSHGYRRGTPAWSVSTSNGASRNSAKRHPKSPAEEAKRDLGNRPKRFAEVTCGVGKSTIHSGTSLRRYRGRKARALPVGDFRWGTLPPCGARRHRRYGGVGLASGGTGRDGWGSQPGISATPPVAHPRIRAGTPSSSVIDARPAGAPCDHVGAGVVAAGSVTTTLAACSGHGLHARSRSPVPSGQRLRGARLSVSALIAAAQGPPAEGSMRAGIKRSIQSASCSISKGRLPMPPISRA